MRDAEQRARRLGAVAAASTLLGIVVSGPLALLVVNATHPQPPWQGPELYARSFHAIQVFPYLGVQTSYLPTLARQYGDRYAGIVATFSMANPTSLAWAIEMWGYAFIGVATWLVAPVFHGSRLARLTAWTFIANGPVSLAGGIVTTALPGWAMTTVGLVAFSLWNVLLGVMAALALVMFRRGLVFRRANPARRLGSPANIAACEA